MADKKTEVTPKNRLEVAEITEISLVKAGAVEDADYVVLQKEASEELPSEPVEKTAEQVLSEYLSGGLLTKEQAISICESFPDVLKEDTMEEEGTEDQMEAEGSEAESEAEKGCKTPVQKSTDDRLEALENRLEELIAKLAPATEVAPETPVEKETREPAPVSTLARTVQILNERKLAREVAPEARFASAVQKLNGKLEEVTTVVTDMKRRLARECGQDA